MFDPTEVDSSETNELSLHSPLDSPASIDTDVFLEAALCELDALFNQGDIKQDQEKAFSYLLSLWASFSIYQLEPNSSAKEWDDATTRSTEDPFRVIRLKEAWKILDFGDGLITSAGENYAHYSTGPLLRTVNYMVDCLVKRGAKKVIFSGSLPAKRFAWLRCRHYDIKTCFNPKKEDWQCQTNIERIQRSHHLPVFSI